MGRSAHQSSSVVLSIRLWLSADNRSRVLDSLRSRGERTRVQPGCRRVEISVSADDIDGVTMIEEWESLAALESHIRSTDFRVVLAAIDLSSQQPEIHVDHGLAHQGFEYLQNVLK